MQKRYALRSDGTSSLLIVHAGKRCVQQGSAIRPQCHGHQLPVGDYAALARLGGAIFPRLVVKDLLDSRWN